MSDEQGGITEIRGMSAEEFSEVAAKTKRILFVVEDADLSRQDARPLSSQLQPMRSINQDDQVPIIELWFN